MYKMALVKYANTKMNIALRFLSHRNFSECAKPIDSTGIKKSVYISQSKDIFTNLALEDWLYRNYDFTNHHVLMLWCSDPCVVIGRHQNPWVEANVSNLNNITEKGVQLARRNSGGGTVYHDQGNINLTFFTPRNQYNRKLNLELIVRAIFRKYAIKIDISPREDLVIRNSKISGTAAKVGRDNAYHHCTLLVDVDKKNLKAALQRQKINIVSNATKSITSKVRNLKEEHPKINIDGLLSAVGWEYLRTSADTLVDGGKNLANLQHGFQRINPTEEWFSGITAIRNSLADWEWCYGKTPKFSITKSFPVPIQFLNNYNETKVNLSVTMIVEQGRVSDVTLYVPPGLSSVGFSGEAKVITSLKGHKFTEDAINSFKWSLNGIEYDLTDDKHKFVTDCVRQVMTSF